MTPAHMAALHARCVTVPRPWSATEIAQLLADSQVYALIQPNGFLIGRCVAGEAELLTIAVAPEAQGQGLGAMMVSHAGAVAQAAGLEAITLYTNAAMQGAQRLYARLGFDLVERRHQDGFDRLFYRKAVVA